MSSSHSPNHLDATSKRAHGLPVGIQSMSRACAQVSPHCLHITPYVFAGKCECRKDLLSRIGQGCATVSSSMLPSGTHLFFTKLRPDCRSGMTLHEQLCHVVCHVMLR